MPSSELKCEKPRPRKSSKKCKDVKCPDFPICETFPVTSPVIPIFGTETTTLSVPLTLSFSGGGFTLILSGSCATGVFTLSLVLSPGVVVNIDCTSATPIVLGALGTPLIGTLNIAGVPLIGAVPDTFTSSTPGVANTCAGLDKNCGVVVSGSIVQDLSFTGVAAPLPAAVLTAIADAISAAIADLFAACAGELIPAAVLAAIPAAVLALLGAPATIGELIAAVLPFVEPGIVAALSALLAVASEEVATTITVPPFPFMVTINDPQLKKIKKCDVVCADTTAVFDRVTNSPLTASGVFTLSATLSCPLVVVAPVAVTAADILTAAGLTTDLSSIFCVSLGGATCIPVTPAVTKTDDVTTTINKGDACFCSDKPQTVFKAR